MATPSSTAVLSPPAGVAARRQVPRGRRTVALVVGLLGLVAVLVAGVASVLPGLDLPGGPAIALGTLTALAGTYLCLALLLLVSRLPWLERALGHDGMVALHRRVAPWSLVLITAHVVLITLGYAQSVEGSFLGQLWSLVTTTAWMMPAAAAFVLMLALGVSSYRRVRARVRHETWWVAHLYFYLAVALSFGHQVTSGHLFVENPVQRWLWIALYAGVAGAIVVGRLAIPAARSVRHGLRVREVVEESPGVVSMLVTGRDLDALDVRGGQFLLWRFVTREWWWQAHPYSVSGRVDRRTLRITVRERGDQSRALRSLPAGTRIWIEGPYGVATADARHGDRVVAIAAGVGIGAVRALLDDLPAPADVTVVHRVPDLHRAPLRDEVAALCAERGWAVQHVAGAVTPGHLRELVTTGTDLYVCGPPAFVSDVVGAARAGGVPAARIHHESFAL